MNAETVPTAVLAEFGMLPRYVRMQILIALKAVDRRDRDTLTFQREKIASEKMAATENGIAAMRFAIERYERPSFLPGQVWEYDASNPHLITPTPAWRPATIVWNDGENIHYRRDGRTTVDQTPIARFMEIVRPVGVF